jgi:adenosine kinase
MTLDGIAQRVDALVVTRGEQGAEIYAGGKRLDIPSVPVEKVVDPTGCGDAFRAGMMYGLSRGMDWETTGRISSLMGAIKIEHQGGQNHAPSLVEIEERFYQAFGYRF